MSHQTPAPGALDAPGGPVGALGNPPERILMLPGPSNLHPRVRQALGAPLVGHKDPYFLELMERVTAQLRCLFQTVYSATFALPATGGSGMDAALINLLEPGDAVVVGVCGFFGERMVDIAQRVGARATVVQSPWGQPLDPEDIRRALERSEAKVVAVVHGETSTGVCQPLEEIAHAARAQGALLVVDAVASLGGVSLPCDALGVDVCFSGSQKCLSAPPGLAPITLSPAAMARILGRRQRVPSFYFDLTLHARYWSTEHIYHHTAPVLNVYALHQALCLIEEEGLEARFARHRLHARAATAGLEALGLHLLPEPAHRLASVLAVLVPEGVAEAPVRDVLATEFQLDISGGLGAYAGRLWRIGIMGHSAQRRNVALLLNGLEVALRRQGYHPRPGAALEAAEAVYAGAG
ncbi:MAG: alanine--glyoxylate aminotransferase family protein [Chloroflexi bacterium]|nr:alanine--glyoxylate aminotransferase family protein [Chloroflexota bacterium]